MWSTPAQGTGSEWWSANVCGVAEVEAVEALGDDDRVAAVGREVHVVRIVDRDRAPPGLPVRGSIGVRLLPDVVRDVERAQVPRGHDVLRQRADGEVLDHPVRPADRSRRRCCSGCSGRRRAALRSARRRSSCRPVVGVDVAASPPVDVAATRRRPRGARCGTSSLETGLRSAGAAPAGEQDPSADARPPRDPSAARRAAARRTRMRPVDASIGDDPARRRAERGAAAADHVDRRRRWRPRPRASSAPGSAPDRELTRPSAGGVKSNTAVLACRPRASRRRSRAGRRRRRPPRSAARTAGARRRAPLAPGRQATIVSSQRVPCSRRRRRRCRRSIAAAWSELGEGRCATHGRAGRRRARRG